MITIGIFCPSTASIETLLFKAKSSIHWLARPKTRELYFFVRVQIKKFIKVFSKQNEIPASCIQDQVYFHAIINSNRKYDQILQSSVLESNYVKRIWH